MCACACYLKVQSHLPLFSELSLASLFMWMGISHEGERFPYTDFSVSSSSCRFALLTTRKLFGLKVKFLCFIHRYTFDERHWTFSHVTASLETCSCDLNQYRWHIELKHGWKWGCEGWIYSLYCGRHCIKEQLKGTLKETIVLSIKHCTSIIYYCQKLNMLLPQLRSMQYLGWLTAQSRLTHVH